MGKLAKAKECLRACVCVCVWGGGGPYTDTGQITQSHGPEVSPRQRDDGVAIILA